MSVDVQTSIVHTLSIKTEVGMQYPSFS